MQLLDLSKIAAVGGIFALLGACFSGGFVQGLPCSADADCGPQLQCQEGLCGGPGDPALCGNGLHDVGEECDDGNLDDGDACTPSCQLPVCGDGYVGPSEGCDDGNTVDGDGCTAACQLPTDCGNGEVEPGEECDDGNNAAEDACTPACQLPVCGDGYLGPGEVCDDGNTDDGDACASDCQGTCGNGAVEPGEECDDHNTAEGDACTPTCLFPVCGDGYLGPEEVCDDGNDIAIDECTTACTLSPEPPTLELTLAQVKQFRFHWEPALGAEWYELYERKNEGEEFVQVGGMLTETSYSLTVPLHFRTHASYRLRACNAMRCVDSAELDVTGNLVDAIGYFKASTNTEDANFGSSVALSGDGETLAVGAPGETGGGAVYVSTRVGGQWVQQRIEATDGKDGGAFGRSVALSDDGKTLVVGAALYCIEPHDQAGEIYVYTEVGGVWVQKHKYESEKVADGFGCSVAISGNGDLLTAGAHFRDVVYSFQRMGEVWAEPEEVTALNTEEGDRFGRSVALAGDGSTLVVGAPSEASSSTDEEDNSMGGAGAAYVFFRAENKWVQEFYLKAPEPSKFEFFGQSIALSFDGGTLVIGGPGEVNRTGSAYIFERTDNWQIPTELAASNAEELDLFGIKVGISNDGNTLIIGAPDEQGVNGGLDSDESNNGVFQAGAAYVFVRAGGEWPHQAYVKSPIPGIQHRFGLAVAMSANGETLAIGAHNENSGATGVGGNPLDDSSPKSGAVYVY